MSVEATDDVSGEVADNVSVEEAGADHESSQAVDPTVPAVDPTVPLAILDPHAAAAAVGRGKWRVLPNNRLVLGEGSSAP